MENTQVINWDAEEEEVTEIPSGSLGYSLEPIGRLRLFSSTHGPERDFPLYLGKNVIGRSPDCSVALPFPSISKQHAVIEISACNKAPVLQDCGSLNGTQLVKPPKVLPPGVSHRLRDQELILFADFPCQYHRLDVPPPLVSRGLLTVEKTPRVQGGSQASRVLLAEDSEEEVDFPSGRYMANGSRNPTSPSATVVPESDEEGSSPAPSVPGPSLPFDLGSDTDEEPGQHLAAGESSSAARDGAAAEAVEANGVTAGIQLALAQPAEQKLRDTEVKSEAGDGATLERGPTGGEDSDTDVEEGKTPRAVPPERNHTPMVINSDTDEEDEVSAAVTLAHLKERGITLWSRDPGVEEVKSQPQILVERSQSASGKDSDTDVEEEKREVVPDSPMDIDEALLVTHSESQPPHRPSEDVDKDVDICPPGGLLEGDQASSATGDSGAQVKEEVPPEPAVTLGETYQLPLEEAQPPEEAWETAGEEGSSSAVADVRQSRQPGAENAGTEWAATACKQESTLEMGVQGKSPAAPVEPLVVSTATPGDPTQPQKKGAQTPTGKERGAQMGRTKNAKDCRDESEDLCLPATQCFVKTEDQNSEAVQSLEDEATQVFPCTLPQEPGPSYLSFQTPGPGALDVPWEVLATQPFCLREPETSEPQLMDTHLEAHGSHPPLPRASAGQQHLLHTEPLGTEDREMQTVEKAMGHLSCKMKPAGEASRGDPELSGHHLLSPVPEASSPPQSLLTSQSQKQSTPQPLLLTSSPSELHLPETFHTKPHVRPRRSSRMTPSPHSSAALKPYTTCPTNLPAAPRPTSRATRGRANRSSTRTPELVVPTDSELQPPASTEQPVIPKPTSPVIQGSTNGSFVKTHEPVVLTGPEIQPPASTEQPVTPNPTPQATRGRPRRSSVKTPEPLTPIGPDLQPPASTEQPVIPKPTSQATRGRPCRSSVKTPEPLTPIGPDLQPPASTEQPVIPKPTSRVTRGRPRKSSTRTPEPVVPTGPDLQPSASTEQPGTPNPTSRVTRGRSRKCVRTPEPVVPTGPDLQPPTSEPSSQDRTHRSSVRTPETSIPTAPERQPFTSREHPAPKPTTLGTSGRTWKSSIEDSESVGPVAPDFEPPISTDLVASEVTSQSITLKSSPLSASPVSATSELQPPVPTAQPVPLEPIPQASHRRRRKAAGKQGSHTVPIDHKPYSAPSEPESQSSANQASALETDESIAPEPAIPQVPETLTHIPPVQNEAAGRSGLIPKPQPEASRARKKPSATTTSPLQKRPRRQVPQKTIVPKEEDPAEMPVKEEPQEIAIPTPGKRKRDRRAEDETQGNPSRSRRAKPNQETVAPKVLFTGVVDSRGERAVLALGGSLASSVNEASHLVTDRIRRTVKFLCALGKGIPILSLNWLYQSRKAGHFLPPDDYMVTDPEQEKNFSFSLRDSLSRARQQKLLEGYEIHVTPGVQPPPPQMGEIISCCGGTILPSMPHSYKPHRVVITCTEDLPRCAIPSRLGLPLLSPEFLLTGVLKQEATPEAFVLSN
ncbi:mediator of DNA damage checkpoint protein 1 [Mesocricetus auratus]|uniref:Mediator of DNA damage checkpoint protein 1 n=1 Tax=Mesocricetus auratus TaxID=10036 RepID=A0A1U8CRN0_MESAU|nr:mediator of DNA damage checkpoint protein 1 [Mesocricetus auratus]XP_040588416.1 mediator of DNA damage checkpoint protein 1 [Mesocricetus auratus]XP_040588417.1 mediator of DNA damage checkpoint protein 1 [Mesocricetus auratus]